MKYLAKFYFIINDPLPVLLGNEQDLGHENTVNIACFTKYAKCVALSVDQSANGENS